MAARLVFQSSSPPRIDGWHSDNVFATLQDSPTRQDGEGELSPSFDASFASVMSLTPHLNASTGSTAGSVSDGMDVSPAPIRKVATEPVRGAALFGDSFFSTVRPTTASPPVSPRTTAPHELRTSQLGKRATLPAIVTHVSETSRHRPVRSLGQSPDYESAFPLSTRPPSRGSAGRDKRTSFLRRPKSPLAEWSANRMLPPIGMIKRHTDTEVPSRPALLRNDYNMQRQQSAPAVPTYLSSPSAAMDVDPRSPAQAEEDDENDEVSLGEAWEVDSPMPAPRPSIMGPHASTRKRSLCSEASSPISVSARDSSPLRRPSVPRLFERTATTTSVATQALARRRGSQQTGVGHGRRPSMGGTVASFHGSSGTGPAGIDEQMPLIKRARPPFPPRSSRRTQSSVDCTATTVISGPRLPSALALGKPPHDRASSLAVPSASGYFDVLPPAHRAISDTYAATREANPSPPLFAGSFACQEHDGKALRCHNVKDDGLMRITSETLVDVLQGKYDALIESFLIVDCRFDYEYNGGHVGGAINLQDENAVEEHFLRLPDSELPKPSRSGQPDPAGNTRKMVVIFHCEFSAKRAPTMAKHLRSRDRALNSAHYPAIHYPELYVLEGGYEAVYRKHPHVCLPRGYVKMDDPNHLMARHSELNKFRQRQALTQRAKSFTFGETLAVAPSLAPTLAPTAEDPNGDTSFGSSSDEAPVGDSPCPPAAAKTVLLGKYLAPPRRAPISRAVTTTRL